MNRKAGLTMGGLQVALARMFLISLAVVGLGCTVHSVAGSRSYEGAGLVRVALTVNQAEVRFASSSRVELATEDGTVVARGKSGAWRAYVEPGGIVIEHAGQALATVDVDAVVLRATGRGQSAAWTVGADNFAGELVVRRSGGRTVTLVNRLGIEEYLRGVVPWEIGRPEEEALEAVKAQAIAARTYTYSHLGHWDGRGFDVHDDEADQVYRGVTGVHPVADRAIKQTRGQILVHDGSLIRAYYSSTCGGHTSTLSDVWAREMADYLVGRRDAGEGRASWCSHSPHFRWTEVWSARELGDAIRKYLPAESKDGAAAIGTLRGLEVGSRDRSGRVQVLRVMTDSGDFEVWGDRIRWVLRPVHSRFSILRSTMFEVENLYQGEALVGVRVRGGGFGHGVGLCQTGALAMARDGIDAEDILRHYYRDVEVAGFDVLRP